METTIICKECGRELPATMFKMTRWGKRCHVCNECFTIKQAITKEQKREERKAEIEAAKEEKRILRISDFTPRELMEELARRGYVGTLHYTVTHDIDITNF